MMNFVCRGSLKLLSNSLYMSLLWHTLSKAFLMLKNIAIVICFLLKSLEISSEMPLRVVSGGFCLSIWWVKLCYVRLLSFKEFSSVAEEADGS